MHHVKEIKLAPRKKAAKKKDWLDQQADELTEAFAEKDYEIDWNKIREDVRAAALMFDEAQNKKGNNNERTTTKRK